jgi:hypothetical protein
MQNSKKLMFAVAMMVAAAACQAQEITKGFRCAADQKASKLFEAFQAKGLLAKTEFHSEDDIAYYEARGGLTAFGMPLVAMFGPNAKVPMPGTASPQSYTLVLKGMPEQAKSALHALGIHVAAGREDLMKPVHVTVEVAKDPGELPFGADPKAAYVEVSCQAGF